MTVEWKKIAEETPQEFDLVFFVDPDAGVTIGYYNGMHWKTDDNIRIWSNVIYWMPIEYPPAPEGSVDTDWD